jgi:hypothetical protein
LDKYRTTNVDILRGPGVKSSSPSKANNSHHHMDSSKNISEDDIFFTDEGLNKWDQYVNDIQVEKSITVIKELDFEDEDDYEDGESASDMGPRVKLPDRQFNDSNNIVRLIPINIADVSKKISAKDIEIIDTENIDDEIYRPDDLNRRDVSQSHVSQNQQIVNISYKRCDDKESNVSYGISITGSLKEDAEMRAKFKVQTREVKQNRNDNRSDDRYTNLQESSSIKIVNVSYNSNRDKKDLTDNSKGLLEGGPSKKASSRQTNSAHAETRLGNSNTNKEQQDGVTDPCLSKKKHAIPKMPKRIQNITSEQMTTQKVNVVKDLKNISDNRSDNLDNLDHSKSNQNYDYEQRVDSPVKDNLSQMTPGYEIAPKHLSFTKHNDPNSDSNGYSEMPIKVVDIKPYPQYLTNKNLPNSITENNNQLFNIHSPQYKNTDQFGNNYESGFVYTFNNKQPDPTTQVPDDDDIGDNPHYEAYSNNDYNSEPFTANYNSEPIDSGNSYQINGRIKTNNNNNSFNKSLNNSKSIQHLKYNDKSNDRSKLRLLDFPRKQSVAISDLKIEDKELDKWNRIIHKYNDRLYTWRNIGLDIIQLFHNNIFRGSSNYYIYLEKYPFHGELYKLSKSISFKETTYAFSHKFCAINQDKLVYFNTKEDLLRFNTPVFSLDIADVVETNKLSGEFISDESVQQIKPLKQNELYYFYIKIEKIYEDDKAGNSSGVHSTKVRYSNVGTEKSNEKSRRSTLLDSKNCVYLDLLVKTVVDVRKYQNLLIFASESEDYVNSWVYILDYLIKQKLK